MHELVGIKFAAGRPLAGQLLETYPCELVEGNTWGDTFWGVCRGVGLNYLGRLLMGQRTKLLKEREVES